jgi:hypothetical protein
MNPPALAVWLLEAALPPADGEAIAGDLHEEFREHVLPARGPWLARWWYRWQVARSLAPLFLRSWQRATIARASAAVVAAGVIATLPATLLLLLRSFVLQQVPLKTTAEISPAFAAGLGAVMLLTAAAALGTAITLCVRRGEHRRSRDSRD